MISETKKYFRFVIVAFLGGTLSLAMPALTFAQTATQEAQPVKMDDLMWTNGKIYLVVLVALTILLGILFTLFYIERRVKKMEKKG